MIRDHTIAAIFTSVFILNELGAQFLDMRLANIPACLFATGCLILLARRPL